MNIHGTAGGADRIFGEMVFGSIGLAVIIATAATLASIPDASEPAAVPPAETAAASLWIGDASLHLVDVSAMTAPNVQEDPADDLPPDDPPTEVPSTENEVAPVVLADRSEDATPDTPVVAEADPQPAPKGPTSKKETPKKGRRCTEAPDPAIRSVTADTWSVDRSVVQRYTRDWSRLNTLGWSQTHKGADGRADGMEIGGIRCGSDLHDAGFRNGDIIHSVNGRKIHSIPSAIFAYTSLYNDHVFSVAITRRGEHKTLTYRLKG